MYINALLISMVLTGIFFTGYFGIIFIMKKNKEAREAEKFIIETTDLFEKKVREKMRTFPNNHHFQQDLKDIIVRLDRLKLAYSRDSIGLMCWQNDLTSLKAYYKSLCTMAEYLEYVFNHDELRTLDRNVAIIQSILSSIEDEPVKEYIVDQINVLKTAKWLTQRFNQSEANFSPVCLKELLSHSSSIIPKLVNLKVFKI